MQAEVHFVPDRYGSRELSAGRHRRLPRVPILPGANTECAEGTIGLSPAGRIRPLLERPGIAWVSLPVLLRTGQAAVRQRSTRMSEIHEDVRNVPGTAWKRRPEGLRWLCG
jgi:hypothetical protein